MVINTQGHGQACGRAEKRAKKGRSGQTGREAGREAEKRADRQRSGQTGREAGRQAEKREGRQLGRQTDRYKNTIKGTKNKKAITQ